MHRNQMHEPLSSLSATPAISSSASECCPDPGGVRPVRRLLFSPSAAFGSCRPWGRLLLLLARRCVDSKSAAAAAESRRGDDGTEQRPCLGEGPPRAPRRSADRAQCEREVSRLMGGSRD
eukprot:scaffold91841_cov53-Phaeocystis_antarctica.AAC.3